MSNESLLRGITHKDLKSLIGKALQDGWEFVGVSGKTMAVIQFRGGRKYQFSMTPSGSNAHKNINSDLRAISGRSYLPQAKTGRGKGGEKGTDFSIPQANKEQFHYHKSHRGISEETPASLKAPSRTGSTSACRRITSSAISVSHRGGRTC